DAAFGKNILRIHPIISQLPDTASDAFLEAGYRSRVTDRTKILGGIKACGIYLPIAASSLFKPFRAMCLGVILNDAQIPVTGDAINRSHVTGLPIHVNR